MSNKIKFIIILFVFITACCKMDKNIDSYSSQFEGRGTADDPYLIFNKAHFMAIGSGYDTINKYYLLAADLVGENIVTEPLVRSNS